MSSPQQPENTQQPDGSGVGTLLKASRLRFGEDLSEVSAILRIRHVYLEAIEDGRYDDLPGPTYAIGFIRAYADHLGLDSDEIIRRFKDRASGEEPSSDLVFPEPISQAGIPGGAIVFIGALVAILAYGVWYVNTSEDGFLAELISPVPDRLAKLAGEESKPERAAPAPESIQKDPDQKDPGQKTESETQSAPPAKPEKTPREAEHATPAPIPAPASGTTDQAAPEPEIAPEKVAEKTPQAARVSEPKPDAKTPAGTEKKPGTEDSPEQQAAAWEPPPGFVKPPEPQSAPEPPAPQPAAPAEAAPATASVGAPVSAGGSSPAAPPTRAPEPVNAPTVVPMDMIPPAPASPRPPAQAAAVAPQAAAPEVSAAASTPPPAPAREETPEVQSAAQTAAREAMPAGGAGRIVVKAKTNSWIQVRDDAAGELVLTRMLKSGDSYIVPDRSGLTLSTGNAGALEILVDGEPVPAVGGEGTVRRKIVLDPERLKSGTAVRE